MSNQVIRQELDNRQRILDNLNTRLDRSLGERRNSSIARVVDGVQSLNAHKTELVALLSDREELLKYALNRWADFQKLYAELRNINEWFGQKEEALNRFQRIVTQREFEIALEDVKVGKSQANMPFSSSCLPPLQSESKCEVFVMVISSTLYMNEN